MFEPSHTVEFLKTAQEPDSGFMPGWIELRTGRIHQDIEAVSPQEPFLRGRIHPKGMFMVFPSELREWAGAGGSSSVSTEKSQAPLKGESSSQASIRSVEGPSVEVRFQPKEITIEHGVVWQAAGAGSLAFESESPRILTVELQFHSDSGVYESHIRRLEELTQRDGDLRRPPKCLFGWGPNFPRFSGVIESLSVKYTHFLSDGTPVRATVHLRMKEATRLLTQAERNQIP
jgi:hypothetical protein